MLKVPCGAPPLRFRNPVEAVKKLLTLIVPKESFLFIIASFSIGMKRPPRLKGKERGGFPVPIQFWLSLIYVIERPFVHFFSGPYNYYPTGRDPSTSYRINRS